MLYPMPRVTPLLCHKTNMIAMIRGPQFYPNKLGKSANYLPNFTSFEGTVIGMQLNGIRFTWIFSLLSTARKWCSTQEVFCPVAVTLNR